MRRRLLNTAVLFILVIFTLSLAACVPQSVASPTPAPAPPQKNTLTPPSIAQPALPSIKEVVAKVKPSVVAIDVEISTRDIFNQPTTEKGAGSGWIIRQDGYIVTNNHVVQGANKVIVTLNDGRTFPADTVQTDPLTDLAIVKINAQNLPAAAIGDSSKLSVGDWLVAIGNALGQGISATAGVASSVNVTLSQSPGQTLLGLIQTDAAINPGNSGGPLVNMAGEVIGINSIKIAEVGVEGMGYAISINEALPIIEGLIQNGRIIRPWLGVGVLSVDPSVASSYNLAVDKGALISEVAANSPAEKAGLQAGDVITMMQDQEIGDVGALVKAINSYKIGQTVTITYMRGETKSTAQATLAESPPPQQ